MTSHWWSYHKISCNLCVDFKGQIFCWRVTGLRKTLRLIISILLLFFLSFSVFITQTWEKLKNVKIEDRGKILGFPPWRLPLNLIRHYVTTLNWNCKGSWSYVPNITSIGWTSTKEDGGSDWTPLCVRVTFLLFRAFWIKSKFWKIVWWYNSYLRTCLAVLLPCL